MADLSLEVIPNAMYALHALTIADLEQWSITELYEWADEELKRLATELGLFVEWLPTLAYGANQNLVPLPDDHLATLRVGRAGTLLRPTTERELRAGDDDWEQTADNNPRRWVGDGFRENWLTLYPLPSLAGVLDVFYQHTEPTVTSTATVAPQLSPVIADVLTLRMIAEARSIETDAQMPEVASFAQGLTGLYRAVLMAYYSGGM